MPKTKFYDPVAEDEAKKAEAKRKAEEEWAAAAPAAGATMEEAVAADAARQAEEAAAAQEALDDADFRKHLAKIGGAQMAGDLTKSLLEIVDQLFKRHGGLKKGWRGLQQDAQQDVINRCEWASKAVIAAAVSGVAGNRFPALPSTLKTVAIGDKGYKLTLETVVTGPEHKLALLNAVSEKVLVVLADPEIYMQHDPIKPMKDEPELPLTPAPEPEPEAAKPAAESPLAESAQVH